MQAASHLSDRRLCHPEWRILVIKSFLLLFFKKEALSFSISTA
jgi:hypothetical protein